MKSFIAITATAGLVLTAIGAANLKRSNEGAGLAYHHNPLAIQESAYGMLLAELSQNTVDEVWHLGIEQVNPASHGHDDHEGHDHGPGEDCESCKKADEAKELLDSVTSAGDTKKKDDHKGHDHATHAEHDDHSGHDPVTE